MIISKKPVSMAEAVEYINKNEATGKEVLDFTKNFVKLKPQEAKDLRKKLEDIDLMKLREDHLVKIIDLLPNNEEELNKICVGVGLSEDETKKIFETIKEFI